MSLKGRRRGGRLWPAVLVVSAVLLGITGWQLVSPRGAALELPVSSEVVPIGEVSAGPDPRGGPTARADASPTPSPSTRASASRAPTKAWPTRPARVPAPARVESPRTLRIPTLGLDFPVVATGVDAGGAMALPAHPTELGWYSFGAGPGTGRGTVVLGGHVDSDRYGIGPLSALGRVTRGDTLEVVTAQHRFSYVVVAVQRVTKRSLDPDEIFDRDGKPALRLITCAGPWDPDRGGYQDNLVVTARPRQTGDR